MKFESNAIHRYKKIKYIPGAAKLAAAWHHELPMFQRHPIQNSRIMLITTNTQKRVPIFADSAAARIAVETLYSKQEFYSFFLFGFVIMPDHCHFLIQVPEGGYVSKLMNVYKRSVSFAIGMGAIWQSRFHIVLPKDPAAALKYIHQNPVRAGLCKFPEEYLWSSACGKWDVEYLDLI